MADSRDAASPAGDDHSSFQSALDAMKVLDERTRAGQIGDFQYIPTGLDELDRAISGGFRLGQLVLLSGSAGVGKTSLSLQIARNIAASGQAVCLYVCYEHETEHMLQRLISMESIDKGDGSPTDGLRLKDIAGLVDSPLTAPFDRTPSGTRTVDQPRLGFVDVRGLRRAIERWRAATF